MFNMFKKKKEKQLPDARGYAVKSELCKKLGVDYPSGINWESVEFKYLPISASKLPDTLVYISDKFDSYELAKYIGEVDYIYLSTEYQELFITIVLNKDEWVTLDFNKSDFYYWTLHSLPIIESKIETAGFKVTQLSNYLGKILEGAIEEIEDSSTKHACTKALSYLKESAKDLVDDYQELANDLQTANDKLASYEKGIEEGIKQLDMLKENLKDKYKLPDDVLAEVNKHYTELM